MKYPLPLRLIAIILGGLFFVFVVLYENRVDKSMQEAVEEHARIVSTSLWNLNQSAHSEYLSIVATHYSYETISITDQEGKVFLTAGSPAPNWHKAILLSLKLIPRVRITSPVIYDGQIIGTVIAIWYRSTIYTYFYILLVLVLILNLLYFYNRLLKINIFLEDTVEERTKHLSSEIIERKQAERDLKASESFLNSVIENIPNMIFVKDAKDFRFLKFNRAGEELLGYSRDTLIGKNDYDFFPKEDADLFTAKDREVIANKKALNIPEESIQTKKRGRRILHTKKIPILSENGAPLFLLGISEDITKRKRAAEEKSILESKLRQSQKMESIGTLAGGIAHDFNNILSAVMGYTELAAFATDNPERLREYLNHIFEGATQARDLVNQILTFSRRSDRELKPLRIQSVVKEALKLLRSSIPTTIEIKQDIDPDLETVLADSTEIHQLIMNLCTNAYHAMRESGGMLSISLQSIDSAREEVDGEISQDPCSYLVLEVSDTGVGMSKEVQNRIFEPYFTTKGKGEGTGLGMAVVHGIVSRMNGHVSVNSEPGQGTTFKIYFPVIGVQEEGVIDNHLDSVQRGNERILVVDDNVTVSQMISEILEVLGYEVDVFTNSVVALNAFQKEPDNFDLVITDMTMPNMTGTELAKQILAVQPQVPIILCTGYNEMINEEVAKMLGIRVFLMKPIVISDLAKAVRETLGYATDGIITD